MTCACQVVDVQRSVTGALVTYIYDTTDCPVHSAPTPTATTTEEPTP